MDKDALAFLDGETVEETPIEQEAPQEAPEAVEEAPEPKAEQPEEPKGEQTGEKPGVTPTPEPDKTERIPVTALLDEREKRQEAQRELREAQAQARQLQEQLRKLQQPKQEAPDWYVDPDAAHNFHQQRAEQQFTARLMQLSKFQAERDFGAETVQEAIAYFDKYPQASHQFRDHPSPFHAAVEFYKRQKVVEEIGTDPEAYKQRLRAELEAELRANASTVQPTKPKSPPPSVASAPSVGREQIVPGNGFDVLFPD